GSKHDHVRHHNCGQRGDAKTRTPVRAGWRNLRVDLRYRIERLKVAASNLSRASSSVLPSVVVCHNSPASTAGALCLLVPRLPRVFTLKRWQLPCYPMRHGSLVSQAPCSTVDAPHSAQPACVAPTP